MLASVDAATGCLQPSAREWSRLITACRRLTIAAFTAHTAALAAAARGADPREAGWTPDNVRWLLTQLGPVTGRQMGRTWE